MSKIVIKNLDNRLLDNKDNSKSVLNIIHENHIDWMFACGGNGRCTTCKIVVTKGLDNLSEMTEAEIKFSQIGKLAKNERLACQCSLRGDVEVEVAAQNKFPHMKYSY